MLKILFASTVLLMWNISAMNLSEAAYSGDVVRVQEFLNKGMSANMPDGCGWTPLHSAVLNRHYNVVRTFLAHGLRYQVRNLMGYTPTDFATPEIRVLIMHLPIVEWGNRCGEEARILFAMKVCAFH